MFRRRTAFLACLLSLPTACTSISSDLDRQLLRPPSGWLVEPTELGLAAEPFVIALHSEASLTGWWIPSPRAAGRTVVLLHDETTNASAQHPYYTFLHAAGFHVLVLDPRGYGRSIGTPTLRAWLFDLNAVFDWLQQRPDVDRDRIALFGTSLGSVAAMWAARTHRECRAVVFEHLPSLREMLRATVRDGDSALGAYAVGVLEFSGLPEDIEPIDNAPHTKARALFLATENELPRNREALLATYAAYAGPKDLWIVPATGQAPHAMLTHDGEYQRAIVAFLTAAFAGEPRPIETSWQKVRDASDGGAWYEIGLQTTRAATAGRWAIEACAVLPDGALHFARTWVDGATGAVRMKLPEPPAHVTAVRVHEASPDDDRVFVARSTPLSRSGAAVAELWPRIEELRNDRMSVSDCRTLAEDLQRLTAAEPFDPRLEAELADVFAKIGIALDERPWLERAVAAVPEHPERHFWPGPVVTFGFPQQDAVAAARQRLQRATEPAR